MQGETTRLVLWLATTALAGAFASTLAGCGSRSGSSDTSTAIAPVTSGATNTNGTATSGPGTGTTSASSGTPATQPTSAHVGAPPPTGSGGRGGTAGTFTRTITTPAQGNLPAVKVDYRVFVPMSYDTTRPIALVISELTPLTLWEPTARAKSFIVVEQQGYRRNGGFTFDVDVLALDEILADVQRTWNVDLKRVYLTGFSAGAHWSYVVGLSNADQFAALGISAGSMSFAIQTGVWPAQVSRKIPVAIRHGTTDTIVPIAAGRADLKRLSDAGHPVDYKEFADGHTVRPQELAEIWAFLEGKRTP